MIKSRLLRRARDSSKPSYPESVIVLTGHTFSPRIFSVPLGPSDLVTALKTPSRISSAEKRGIAAEWLVRIFAVFNISNRNALCIIGLIKIF